MSDCISRQVAIDIVTPHDDNRIMRDALEELPPAQPERKKAQWKAVRINPRMIRCSNCNNGWWNKELIKVLNFCPNCGADMREVT